MPPDQGMAKPDIFVVARILERLWKEGGPLLKTRLQLATRLNYDILVKYLDWLRERGLVAYESSDGHEVVSLTVKGHETYKQLVYLLNDLLLVKTGR